MEKRNTALITMNQEQLKTEEQKLEAQLQAQQLEIQQLQAQLQALRVQAPQVQAPQVQAPQVQEPQVQERSINTSERTVIPGCERLPKQSNISLLVMYCQSGKTEVVLKDIEELVNKGVVCVLFSDNNRILTEQTNARASNKKILSASIISSAKKKGSTFEFKNFDKDKKWFDETPEFPECRFTCKKAIEYGRVNTIMVCSNERRWSDVESIVETCIGLGLQAAIFVDEADKTCKSENGKPVKSLNKWHNSSDNVIKIVLITGTPYDRTITSKKIKWLGDHFEDKLQLYYLERPFGESYRALKDCRHISYSDAKTVDKVDYVVSYLEENPPQVGLIDLIPADYTKKSHEEMVNAVLGTYHDAVVIINGEHKEIRFSDDTRRSIKLKDLDGKELCDKLGKWYCDEGGKNLRIAMTGGKPCIGRGITISTDKYGFYIDRMIVSGISRLSETIQLMSRCAGHTKHKPSVICPDKIWEPVNVDFEVIHDLLEICQHPDPEKRLIRKQDVEIINAAAMNKIIEGFTVEHEVLKLEECLEKGMSLRGRYKCPTTGHYIASSNLLTDNKKREDATIEDNPTIEYLLHRLSGLSAIGKEHCRWEPLRDGKWVRYWKENV